MGTAQPLYITSNFIQHNLHYQDLIPVIEKCLAVFSRRSNSEIVQPVRTILQVKPHNGSIYVMPVYSSVEDDFVIKIISAFDRGSHEVNIFLFEGATGFWKAHIPASIITHMRTAAVSAVATKYLAPENSNIHTILGAGSQAKSHLAALANVCDFKEVRVWNHNFPKAEAFAKSFGCKAFKSAEEAVRGADVITTVTASNTPVLFANWVKEGAHVNAVGAAVPTRQEIDPILMRSCTLYVDSREGASQESADIVLSKAEIFAELGEVVMGTMEAMRSKTTVFESLGMAIEDLVTSKLVYDKYQHTLTS